MVYGAHTATLTITDLDTSTSVIFALDDSGLDQYGYDTDSPPPSTDSTQLKRAIIVHPIPNLDYDVAQDMGLHALKRTLSGICQKTIRDQLITWLGLPQFTGTNPAGRFQIVAVNRQSVTDSTLTHVALESLVHGPLPGSPTWYKVTLSIVKVSSSQ